MSKFTKLKHSGTPPSGRATPLAAALGDQIYLFGGVRDDFSKKLNTPYNDLYRFDTHTNTWHALTPTGTLPAPRGFGCAIGDPANERFIIFGGCDYRYDLLSSVMFGDLWAYYPKQNMWTQIQPKNQGPCARAKPVIWIDGDKIYVATGVTDQFKCLNDVWAYDTKTNMWTELISDGTVDGPPPRNEALGGAILSPQGNLVIYGGETRISDKRMFVTLNDTWEFNLQTNKWKNITPSQSNIFPPRDHSSAAVIGKYLYIQGGAMCGLGHTDNVTCGAFFPQRSLTDELWRFDLTEHVWSKLGVAGDPLPRMKRNVGVNINNKMYIMAGFDFQWFGGTPAEELYGKGPGQIWNENVYMFDPEDS